MQDARAVDREVHAEARAPEEERRQKEREARLAKQQERLANQKKRHKQEARVRRALKEVNSGASPQPLASMTHTTSARACRWDRVLSLGAVQMVWESCYSRLRDGD